MVACRALRQCGPSVPHPVCRPGPPDPLPRPRPRFVRGRGRDLRPRFARGRGRSPVPVPDLLKSGPTLPRPRPGFAEIGGPPGCSAMSSPKGLGPGLVPKSRIGTAHSPAMSDDAVDYGSDSEKETDEVPSMLPAPAESCMLAHELSVPSCRMPAIAGKAVDRRLCPHRVAHVTAAPPQAVTMTPAPQAMATTKFRTLAHRSDGRRHLPRQHRQHHASKRLQAGHPSRRCPAAPLSTTTRTTALTNGAAQDISRTPGPGPRVRRTT